MVIWLVLIGVLAIDLMSVALTFGVYVLVKDKFNIAGAGIGFTVQRDAKILYLAGGQDQVQGLFIRRLNDRDPVLLSAVTDNVLEYAVSPDRTNVSFIVQTEDLEHRLWLVNIASGKRRMLSNCENAICSRPVWSPDGRRIVYGYTRLSGENAAGLATLWWVNVATSQAKPVFHESQLPGTNPRWSPDGKWLSYATSENVRLYHLDSGESHVIESIVVPEVDWSPDSKKVLYRDALAQDGQFVTQLFVYDLASRTVANFDPNTLYENLSAAWSPDGEWIAVVRRSLSAPRGDQIWVIRPDGTETRTFLDTPTMAHRGLTWSPDGKYLLYDRYQPDSPSLESNIQMIEVETGKTTDPDIQGTDAQWVWP